MSETTTPTKDFKPKYHINFKLLKKTFCEYDGECEIDRCINKIDYCLYCKWRRNIDIPYEIEVIRKRKKENKKYE